MRVRPSVRSVREVVKLTGQDVKSSSLEGHDYGAGDASGFPFSMT